MADKKELPEWLEELGEINKELEERILEANEDKTLIKWSKLLPDLMSADILMLGQYSNQKNENGEKQFGILMLQKDGKTFVPFFTNPDKLGALSAYRSGQFDVIKVNAVRFLQSIKGNFAVLNPETPYARFFNPFDVKILAKEYIDKAPPLEKEDAAQNQ